MLLPLSPLVLWAAVSLPLETLGSAAGGAYAWSLLLSGAVVIASLFPLAAARSKADFTPADLAAPRAMFERLPEWGKRAAWAHQNCFEAFTLFAPAALLCLVSGVSSPVATAAAWLHPALRLAYIPAYVGNVPPLRGLCWALGTVCTGVLYTEGLKAVLAS
ncbi:MAG: MAPEG family protein [Cyanobium sp.]